MPEYGIYANMSKEALLFPGQGIATKWILEYYKKIAVEAPELTHSYISLVQDALNKIHGSRAYNIQSALVGESPELFERTEFYQPVVSALSLVGNAFSYAGLNAEYIAGHSLGECTGVIAAAGMSEEEGLNFIGWRGLFMQQAADRTPSGLINVTGLNPEKIATLCRGMNGKPRAAVALKNAPPAVVLGCSKEYIPDLVQQATEAGAIAVTVLSVAAAFHTPFMEEAAENLAEKLPEYNFQRLEVAVIANLNGESVKKGNIYPRENLVNSLTKPVEWMATMEFLKNKGVETYRIEGPGSTLKQLCTFNGIPKSQIRGTFGKFI